MNIRRVSTTAVLCALLLAALPAPAAARPWAKGFEEFGVSVREYWPLASWLARVFVSRLAITNVGMNESAKVLP